MAEIIQKVIILHDNVNADNDDNKAMTIPRFFSMETAILVTYLQTIRWRRIVTNKHKMDMPQPTADMILRANTSALGWNDI